MTRVSCTIGRNHSADLVKNLLGLLVIGIPSSKAGGKGGGGICIMGEGFLRWV